jgi:hypothetical protein
VNEGPGTNGGDLPPEYSTYSHQPYVTYEIHLHPIYNMPTLWFTLHDLPMGESTFDLESVYRYLVPDEFKGRLRAMGVTGGISAAVSIISLVVTSYQLVTTFDSCILLQRFHLSLFIRVRLKKL